MEPDMMLFRESGEAAPARSATAMPVSRPGSVPASAMRGSRRGRKRVLAIASAGGHWVQLQRLAPAFDGLDVAYASVYPAYSQDVPGSRFYAFDDVSRLHKTRIVKVMAQLLWILVRERPDVVVTTGSGPALIMLALCKTLLRSKTIWIDSIANCEQLSFSGSKARRYADVWLTQWPHLARGDGPHYWGAVL